MENSGMLAVIIYHRQLVKNIFQKILLGPVKLLEVSRNGLLINMAPLYTCTCHL